MDQFTLERLQNLLGRDKQTAPINNLKPNRVTFIRDTSYSSYLYNYKYEIFVIAPLEINTSAFTKNITWYLTKFPEYEFTLYHNYIQEKNKDKNIEIVYIEPDCDIHRTALIGINGLKVVNTPDGRKIPFTHTGRVVIKSNTNIGAYSIIHRGTMSETIINEGCNLGVYTNIGHNCVIGKNNTFAAGVILNGGVQTGENCWFGSSSVVKQYTKICSNVVVGMGSVVTKDITESGIYVGNPARYLKPITEGWNF